MEANLNARDRAGRTPMHLASLEGHSDVVRELATRGANVDAEAMDWRLRPMHAAAASGHTAVVNVLRGLGAGVKTPNDRDETPMHAAASRGQTEVVKALAALGADVKAANHLQSGP